MPKVPYPYEVKGKLVTGNGSLLPICSLSNRSLLPSLTICNFLFKFLFRNIVTFFDFHLLHKDKELLALRNNFRATKKFLIAKFDCTLISLINVEPTLTDFEKFHPPQNKKDSRISLGRLT